MANNGYIVNRSNYTTKKRHKSLSDSTIMERDYMITTNLGGWGDNFIGYDGANNFKILQGSVVNNFRKHSYGKWLKPPTSCAVSYGDESFWGYCDATNAEHTENTIVPKYDYNSLRNFAYFGSCYEMVTTSLEDIINKFPGELYITSEHDYYQDKSDGSIHYLVNESALTVSNPFEIDVFSTYIPREVPESLKYRYFYSSNGSYQVYDKDGNKPLSGSWEFSYKAKDCYSNGDIVATASFNNVNNVNNVLILYKCYRDGEFVIMANGGHEGWYIRPSDEIVNNFFNNLDDFEAFLLNRESKPLYTITIDAPYEGEDGNFKTPKKTFTWPTSHNWNLVLGGSNYSNYVNSLLDIATLYDEYFTDNLWKSMTHEAIKNMDDTITKENSDETVEDYRAGVGRMRGLFLAYGRFFDDIKRQADNIRFTTSVTYDGNGNLPDYFLSDELGLSGWEAYSVKDYIDKSNTVKVLVPAFTGILHEYTASDASTLLLKVLKINSENILSKKGTRRGIESILGMFGLLSNEYIEEISGNTKCAWKPDYKIDEYTRILSGRDGRDGRKQRVMANDTEGTLTVETWNQYKTTMSDIHSADYDGDATKGLPIAIIEGSMKHDGDDKLAYKYSRYYMVPWFSKSVEYDGNPWYQMKGGWCKLPEKEINEDITSDTWLTDGAILYGETKKKLTLVKNFKELATYSSANVKDKEVFYVYDIDDYEDYFGKKPQGNISHYFVADSSNGCNTNSGETGYYADSAEKSDVLHGWDYVPTDEGHIPSNTENGKRVIYMESLIDDSKENNPHTGYPNYDDGEEFWEYFKQLYKGAIDNNELTNYAYDCDSGELKPEIANEGFDVLSANTVDNIKCWYFTESDTTQIATKIVKNEKATLINAAKNSKNLEKSKNLDLSGFTITNDNDGYSLTSYEGQQLYDFEQGSNVSASAHTVGQSFAIMNTKVLTITFFNREKDKDAYKHFLYNAVIPYLRQVIPSTCIWEVKIKDE